MGHPSLVYMESLSPFILCHLASYFASVIIMRGCSWTININMGPNKLLAQLTHTVVFVVRVAWGVELCDHTVMRWAIKNQNEMNEAKTLCRAEERGDNSLRVCHQFHIVYKILISAALSWILKAALYLLVAYLFFYITVALFTSVKDLHSLLHDCTHTHTCCRPAGLFCVLCLWFDMFLPSWLRCQTQLVSKVWEWFWVAGGFSVTVL